MLLSDNHWIISGFPDFNTFKITFWEFCNAFTYSQNYSLWQFHLNFEMEKEKMSRFGQGGFSYMRRPLDPGLFSFGCILSKEMSLFQSLLITMGFGEIKDSHMSLKFTADLFMLVWKFLLKIHPPRHLCISALIFIWLLWELYLATGETWKLHEC